MKKIICFVVTVLLICSAFLGCTKQADSAEAQQTATNGLSEAVGDDYVTETNYGKIKGAVSDGVISYKGVPFAAAPVGNLRFAPPQEPEPWNDVLNCTEFGDSAVQADAEEGLTYSEDCLYLNLWRTEEDVEEPMPVLVFIHGGAFSQGSPSKSLYDGTSFAKDGVIQVNLSYRLNGLGFMVSKDMEEEHGYIGNIGMLDQIAGLKWVKENIGYFGGDPNNVTISGESAGSFSVSNLVLSPLAEGLFDRAILESGNVLGQPLTAPLSNGSVTQALENTERLMDALGAESFADLREAEAQAIADESAFSLNIITPSDTAYFPVFDGKVLPENPYEALLNGEYNRVDILAGYNSDEGTLFVEEGIGEEDYISLMENLFGDNAKTMLERYPVDEENSATDRARFMMKMGLRMGSDVMADKLSDDGQNVYLYHFAYDFKALDELGLGTMHALELVFVFDAIPEEVERTAELQAVVDNVHDRWLNFIKNGDPNEGVEVGVEWGKYTSGGKETLVLDTESRMAPAEQAEDIAVLMEQSWNGFEN